MARQDLGSIDSVSKIMLTNSVIIEVGGVIKRMTIDKLIDAINNGDEQLLHRFAWGVTIKQNTQSSSQWELIGNRNMWAEYKSKCGRYLVKSNGHAAKLSSSNSGIYADGTTLDETIGHVMVKFPKLYYRVINDTSTNLTTVWMSMIPIGGKFIPETVIGAYKASMDGTALTSRSGVAPAGSKTINQFWTAAQVNGGLWGLQNYEHRKLMILLALSEYGNPNVQNINLSTNVLGTGLCGTNNDWVDYTTPLSFLTGQTKSLGDNFGAVAHAWTNSAGTAVLNASDVSILGIENPYGQQFEMIQGVYCGSSSNANQTGTEIFLYEGNRMPSSTELASHPSGDYRSLTRLTTSGYVQKMTLGDYFDIVPSTLEGGSNQYWGDYHYANSAGQLVLFGGTASYGAFCGLACASSSGAWSNSGTYMGSRLAYYGKLTVIPGAQLIAE